MLFPFRNSVSLSLDTIIFFGGSSLLLGVAINEKDLELLIGLIYLTGVLFFLFCFGLFDFVSGDSITLCNHSYPGTRFVLMGGPAGLKLRDLSLPLECHQCGFHITL